MRQKARGDRSDRHIRAVLVLHLDDGTNGIYQVTILLERFERQIALELVSLVAALGLEGGLHHIRLDHGNLRVRTGLLGTH